jgi:hypothetical protein
MASLSGEGVHTIGLRVLDNAGNISPLISQTVIIDLTPPTANIGVAPAANANGWIKTSPATVTLSGSDSGSGVGQLLYTLDGGAQTSFAGSSTMISISGDGQHTVTLQAVDNAGNRSQTISQTVNIDTTAPAAHISVTPQPNTNGWINQAVSIKLSGSDSASGVAQMQYSVDNGTVITTPATSVMLSLSANGQHTVMLTVLDNAGNSTTVSQPVNIDSTAPALTIAANPATLWPPNGSTVSVAVTGTVSDSGSGVDRQSGRFTVLDSQNPFQASGAVAIASDGSYELSVPLVAARAREARTYTIMITVSDLAGNPAAASTVVTVPLSQGTP